MELHSVGPTVISKTPLEPGTDIRAGESTAWATARGEEQLTNAISTNSVHQTRANLEAKIPVLAHKTEVTIKTLDFIFPRAPVFGRRLDYQAIRSERTSSGPQFLLISVPPGSHGGSGHEDAENRCQGGPIESIDQRPLTISRDREGAFAGTER